MTPARCALVAAAAALLACCSTPVRAQISFTNILEPRIGRDPDEARFLPSELVPSASRMSVFDQFTLQWTVNPLRLGIRYETYTASDSLVPHYHEFVRRYAAWTTSHFEATVGNYEAMFGRGLVLRAFELPGVVREEFGTPQFGDSRDLDGVKLRAYGTPGEIVALGGEPRFADQDPTQERRGQVEGASAALAVTTGVQVGGNYLRLDARQSGDGARAEASGAFLQIGFDPWLRRLGIERLSLDTYVEYDRVTGLAIPPVVSSPRARPDEGYGLYWAQTLIVQDLLPGLQWGTSFETKDYQNFELGVNEPPTLVREHSYALLNRSTHVLEPLQEQGTQLETRFDWRGQAALLLNWSRAENARSRQFHERYIEISGAWRDHTLALYADDAQDESAGVRDRDTFGGFAHAAVGGPHAVEIEAAVQRIDRGAETALAAVEDRFLSLAWTWAERFSFGAVRQTTDEPSEAADPVTGEISRRAYDSLVATVDLGAHHELALQWGRRRGGLACVAGTCYKVRSFDGIVARLVTRY